MVTSETAEPRSTRTILARNVAVLMGSQMSTWALSLVGILIIPRLLGADLLGQLHLAGAIWALGSVVISFGMDLTITRAIARDPKRAPNLLASGLVARLMLAVPVTVVVFAYALVSGYSNTVLVLLVLVGIGAIITTVSAVPAAGLQGLDRMGPMSAAAVAGRLVATVGAVAALLLGYGVYAVATASIAAAVVLLGIQLVALFRIGGKTGADWEPARVSRSSIVALLSESLPFLAIALTIAVYQQLDIIILSLVTDDSDVMGWYSAYERLTGTFVFIPAVFMTAAFPTFSRLFANREDESAGRQGFDILSRTVDFMVLCSIPIGFGSAVLSRPIVETLFGPDYAGAAPVLAAGGVVLLLTYLTTTLGTFLIAVDEQRRWTLAILAGALLTVPVDLILIPIFDRRYGNGAVGAVLGFLITESVVLLGAVRLLPAGALGWANVRFGLRVVVAGLVMVLVVDRTGGAGLPIRVAVGSAVYVVMAVVLRLVSRADVEMARELVRSRGSEA